NGELLNQRRIGGERLRKFQIRRDERPALCIGHHLSRGCVRQRAGVEEELLRAGGEVVDGAQQRAVVKKPGAAANHRFARLEWIVSKRDTRTEVIQVAHDRLIFETKAVANHEVRRRTPFVLREDANVSVLLRRSREKVLAITTGNIRQKISGTVEIPGAGRVRKIDESGFDALNVAAEFQRVRASLVGKNFLQLKSLFAAICRAAG